MFLVPELKGLVGSFIHSDMALLILGPTKLLPECGILLYTGVKLSWQETEVLAQRCVT